MVSAFWWATVSTKAPQYRGERKRGFRFIFCFAICNARDALWVVAKLA